MIKDSDVQSASSEQSSNSSTKKRIRPEEVELGTSGMGCHLDGSVNQSTENYDLSWLAEIGCNPSHAEVLI